MVHGRQLMSPSFSERIGLALQRDVQLNSMNTELRTCLLNALITYFDNLTFTDNVGLLNTICQNMWTHFLKFNINEIKTMLDDFDEIDQSKFIDLLYKQYKNELVLPWYRVYELFEFVGNESSDNKKAGKYFAAKINEALVLSRSGYRYIINVFIPISNANELSEIATASTYKLHSLELVSTHMCQAVTHYSDKQKPDYRNSIKESISAVESLCKLIAKDNTTTLAPALEKTTKELNLNPHLREAFKNFYKYTSDAAGIRHGLKDTDKDTDQPNQEDARFFLVTCSAFVNLVIEKARLLNKLPK